MSGSIENISVKEYEKMNKYKDLYIEIMKMCYLKTTTMPVIVEALGLIIIIIIIILKNHNVQRTKRKTWTREDNQLALHCYFRSNSSRRGYRKRMIEIWQECASFQTTSQRLADQVRTIIKKGWFSDLEILDVHQKTNTQDNDTLPDTLRVKQNQPNRNELPSSRNENATLPNNTQPSNPKETLSQEQKIDLENVKRMMNNGKTTLPSLRNIEWRTLKIETIKINKVLPYISTNNITELNELIYAGTKLVCGKIGIP